MKRILSILFFLTTNSLFCQIIFEQGIVRGGVTAGGFSTGMGAGSGSFDVYIEPGSTIKKAYLFFYSEGFPGNVNLLINNITYNTTIFDHKIVVEHVHACATPISLFVRDITADINPNVTNYPVTIPLPSGGNTACAIFNYVSLFIVYENTSLQLTNYSILLNNQNLIGKESYTINSLNPININNPVGFSVFTDRSNLMGGNGRNVFFNGNFIGLIGLADNVNSNWTVGGVKGHFYYQNNQLFGLDDDLPNSTMDGSDGLADVSSFISSYGTNCNFQLVHQKWPNQNTAGVHINLNFFLAYTSPCQSFEATVNKDTTICSGTTAQLTATGGINYEWLPQQDLSCYNCPNPVFAGQKTTTYTCRIWSTDSCSKVLPVRVIVKEPRPDTVNVTNGICGDNNGSFKLGQIQNGTAPFVYSIAGQTNTSGNFTGLGAGTYTYKVTDAMGCIFSDSVNITETNLVKAGYITQKFNDEPLKIGFINNSKNATHYIWVFPNGDTLYSENLSQLFDSGGTYEVMLIAYNNYPHCADTVMHTITIASTLVVLAPNVFTPNGDGKNDTFTLVVKGTKTFKVSIVNRWGTQIHTWEKGNDMHWDGNTVTGQECSQGVYYYTITGVLENGEAFQKQGSLHLMR